MSLCWVILLAVILDLVVMMCVIRLFIIMLAYHAFQQRGAVSEPYPPFYNKREEWVQLHSHSSSTLLLTRQPPHIFPLSNHPPLSKIRGRVLLLVRSSISLIQFLALLSKSKLMAQI
jgi:hypothetical protein